MGIELSGAGEALAAIVVSDEVGKATHKTDGNKDDQTDSDVHKNCANCGVQLTGAYCHGCGQSSHIHRSLLHMFEEVLHGIFHFDTKAWRTIPALIFKPGHLTKQYIEGKRTSFVSPLALFLFLIFLMFFVFSYTMNSPTSDMLHIPDSRENIEEELTKVQAALTQQLAEQAKQAPHSSEAYELREEIYSNQFNIRKLQDALNKVDGKKRDVAALTLQFTKAGENLKSLREAKIAQKSAEKKATNTNAEIDTEAGTKPNVETSAEAVSGSQLASSSASASAGSIEKLSPKELEQSIRMAERELKYFRKQLAAAEREKEKEKEKESATQKQGIKAQSESGKNTEVAASAADAASANGTNTADSDTDDADKENVDIEMHSYFPYVQKTIEHATKNPEFTIYKMKKNASGLAFLLMPIALPFLWLLFAFKRKYVMFDHAVFSLYSLSFMCLLLTTIAILTKFSFNGTAVFLFVTVPPVHMYAQLKHAYSLSVFGTLWRTIALIFIALMSLAVFATIVTMLSA